MTLIQIGSPVIGTPIFQIIALYLDFEGARNIHVLSSPPWGLCRMLEVPDWVWHLDIALDMITGLCYTHSLPIGSLS